MGLLSAIYSLIISGRRFIYSAGLKKTRALPKKVISAGNLTLGGTGKTPAVISLAKEAKKRGFKPCILTRGYKGKAKGPVFVTSGKEPVLSVYDAGDEPVLMARKLEDIPIVMGKCRYCAGLFALDNCAHESIDLFILDDGFQHWGVHRDIDMIFIDATNPFGNGKLFPEGILREPVIALGRAHVIVMTKTDAVSQEQLSAITGELKQSNAGAPIYLSAYSPVSLVNVSGEIKDIESLRNTEIYAFAGIANPSYFKTMLVSRGLKVVKFKEFRDHYIYKQNDIDIIAKEASGLTIITTEKDMVKLSNLKLPGNVFALGIEFSIDEEFYNYIFGRL
ncbi:MAG: tetraacyldisaccharide 4'-kinase [Nitrospirota bacterium]